MLKVSELTKRYGSLTGVERLSFNIAPGEVLGLLGPNGSGKSTTVKMLVGLLEPSSGTIEFNGSNILRDKRRFKKSLGYVPEEPHLYTYLTGPEYLELVGRLRGLPSQLLEYKISEFLRILDLSDECYQPLSEFSKGMRQKVLLAAAVLHDPGVVVLDEPFSGLDAAASRMLKTFIRLLCTQGKVIVFSSHVLEVVEQVCTRVIILKEGRPVACDSILSLRETLSVPSLEAVFAALTVDDDNAADRARALIEVVTAR